MAQLSHPAGQLINAGIHLHGMEAQGERGMKWRASSRALAPLTTCSKRKGMPAAAGQHAADKLCCVPDVLAGPACHSPTQAATAPHLRQRLQLVVQDAHRLAQRRGGVAQGRGCGAMGKKD